MGLETHISTDGRLRKAPVPRPSFLCFPSLCLKVTSLFPLSTISELLAAPQNLPPSKNFAMGRGVTSGMENRGQGFSKMAVHGDTVPATPGDGDPP